jgi:imidazoleglycerol-phosphate dehydratase / histidinol-phosphatase
MLKKILFIDRDGTLILEPSDFQIDSIEKLTFYPEIFHYLRKIAGFLNYELVMVSNQDGLGTNYFPEETFWPIQNLIMRTLENEGIHFSDVLIDKSMPEDNAFTRKPGTNMLSHFMSGKYDLENSFVIGDRLTDMKLAANLGCKAIGIAIPGILTDTIPEDLKKVIVMTTSCWKNIWKFLSENNRKVEVMRITSETDIRISINLNGTGNNKIDTGLYFFNHMLEQLAIHSGVDMNIIVKGDLHVDEHHTIEDTGLVLGEAFLKAIGNKIGMGRYGFCLPMDDCLAQTAIDFSGRPWLIWNVDFKREKIGDVPTELFFHFFKSWSDAACVNLNIQAEGKNEHHKIEAVFKAVARAIRMALKTDYNHELSFSTKEIL